MGLPPASVGGSQPIVTVVPSTEVVTFCGGLGVAALAVLLAATSNPATSTPRRTVCALISR